MELEGYVDKREFRYGTLYLGDTVEMIKNIPKESIDFIYSDPPYGVLKTDKFDNSEAFYSCIGEFYRVCKKDAWLVVWFATSKIDELFKKIHSFKYVWMIACFNAGSYQSGKTPIGDRKVSYIILFKKGSPKLNWRVSDLVFGYEGFRTHGQLHSLHKPTGAHIYLLNAFSNENSIVLDPFAGYGSIPLTCEWLGIKWIAFEKDETKFDVACNIIKSGLIDFRKSLVELDLQRSLDSYETLY